MPVLHSVLAAYGVLDQVAVETTDSAMRAAVEKLLPGTTAPGQRGWFKELQDFVVKKAREQALENGADIAAAEQAAKFPTAEQAVDEMMREGQDSDAMTHRVKQRLLYAGLGIMALANMKDELSISVPVLDNLNLTKLSALFAMAATPIAMSDSGDSESDSDDSDGGGMPTPQLLDVLTERGADGWNDLMADLAADKSEGGGMAPEIMAIPPMKALGESVSPPVPHQITDEDGTRNVTDQGKVTSEVIKVHKNWCSLLTTEFSRTPYDIKKVLDVIDPQNWDNANKFFADMTPQASAADGRSSQILEEVSTHPDIYRIKTELKYVKEDRADDTYVINYDFADRRDSADSQQVKVDSGYILVGPSADGKGVRVLTSKMVAIDGLSPTAVAVFAHAMGWLSIGEMMMFGKPTDVPPDVLIPWTKSADRNALIKPTAAASRNAQASADVQEEIQPVSRLFVREATNAVADYLNVATSETASIADKWLRGELSVGDMVEHTTILGGKLASEPFRLLERMMKNAVGPASSESSNNQARGGDST
jgi:hypothetical protein